MSITERLTEPYVPVYREVLEELIRGNCARKDCGLCSIDVCLEPCFEGEEDQMVSATVNCSLEDCQDLIPRIQTSMYNSLEVIRFRIDLEQLAVESD